MQVYDRQGEEYAQMVLQAQAQTRAERLKRFWEMLHWVLAKSPVAKRPDSPTVVLDLACGICEESRLLSAFFSTGIAGFPSAAVQLIGVDQDPGALQAALAGLDAFDPFFYSPYFHIGMHATFILGDAVHLDVFPQIPPVVDFALMRHQFIARDRNAVKLIVQKALAKLQPEGKILFTSFFEAEHTALTQMLAELPCECLFEAENPRALAVKEAFPEGPAAIDRFVCLVKRKSALLDLTQP